MSRRDEKEEEESIFVSAFNSAEIIHDALMLLSENINYKAKTAAHLANLLGAKGWPNEVNDSVIMLLKIITQEVMENDEQLGSGLLEEHEREILTNFVLRKL